VSWERRLLIADNFVLEISCKHEYVLLNNCDHMLTQANNT